MNELELLTTQRTLRRQLFEGETAIRWRPARELGAQLLLYLDDPKMCWQLAAEWVRVTLGADRADGGFGGYFTSNGSPVTYVALAEAQGSSTRLPPMLGQSFDPAEPGIRALWHDRNLSQISDMSQQRNMTMRARRQLASLGVAAKLAMPVTDEGRPIGLLCADWHRKMPHWRAEPCNELRSVSTRVLGPVLGAALRLEATRLATLPARPAKLFLENGLTPSELRITQLVTKGLSYKEIAREIGRSLSTVDHHLRNIRQKLGVSSTARLLSTLSERNDNEVDRGRMGRC